MNQWDVSGMIWTFGSLIFTLILLAIIAKIVLSIYKTRAALSHAEEYKTIAGTSVAVQQQLVETNKEITELQTRLAAVEKILKDAE